VITGRYRLGDVRHITADCSAAETVLGWRAGIGLADGIASVLADTAGRGYSPEPAVGISAASVP
jgi:dTDP-L-rhamnose 4-epimerase